jgi:glycosyltransferase involved in cell wall biosynthesis
MPDACVKAGLPAPYGGGWMSSLLAALKKYEIVEIGIVSNMPGVPSSHHYVNGINHYILSCKTGYEAQSLPSPIMRMEWERIIKEFKPDIVHIHGTEQNYGTMTAMGKIKIPIVISLQGIISDYIRYHFGDMSNIDILYSHSIRDWIKREGLIHRYYRMIHQAKTENFIIENNHYFIGRTRWDKAHIRAINPSVRYYECHELMRPEFYKNERNIDKVIPHSIFVSVIKNPLKGFYCLLKAVAILKRDFPSVKVYVAGNKLNTSWKSSGYELFIWRLIKSMNLESNIHFCGGLNGQEMAETMAQSRVCVIPSFVENGSNALSEAMLVGTPVVVSMSGGMVSMVRDEETALCFPRGDEAVMAECIRELFINDQLAAKLAHNAQLLARLRHDPKTISEKMMEIYRDVIADYEK